MNSENNRFQQRNNCEIKAYFDQWRVYDLIIQNDYMAHRGIHEALRTSLSSTRSTQFTVLDLGCGDGAKISQTLSGLQIELYNGVDLSEVALTEAKNVFANSELNTSLVQAEFSKYLSNLQTEEVDVVIAGFAIHHLTNDEKPNFLRSIFDKLAIGGDLFLYDIFRRGNETRDQYLEKYCEYVNETWTALSFEQRKSTQEHAKNCDFPVTYEKLADFAMQAGFSIPSSPIFTDSTGFHSLCHLKKNK